MSPRSGIDRASAEDLGFDLLEYLLESETARRVAFAEHTANPVAQMGTPEVFERDPEFDLQRYAKRSFGTFQERPVRVVLRFDAGAARDASAFLFHPDQVIEENGDGSLTVRFTAGGIDEMCWHLFTWGESVTIERPTHLHKRLAQMCAGLAAHHGGGER